LQLVNLYRQFREGLFTLNIRNYLGNTATNKLLIKTLRDEPSHFYYFNNGISCLAEKLVPKGDRVSTKGLQIINGAQTIRSLVKAADRNKQNDLEGALVLVRITQAEKQYSAEGKFRNDIVRFNNTQNIIKASDFRSNDPIHTDLKNRFAEHKRNGKEVVYISKRTDPAYRRQNQEIISLEEFAKVVYSFQKNPFAFADKTSFLFDDSESGGYIWVFGDGKEIWTTMPEPEFRLRSAIWWLSKAFSEQMREDKKKL